jgi:hypothetical protein
VEAAFVLILDLPVIVGLWCFVSLFVHAVLYMEIFS